MLAYFYATFRKNCYLANRLFSEKYILAALLLVLTHACSSEKSKELIMSLEPPAEVETLENSAEKESRENRQLQELATVSPGEYRIAAGDKFNVFIYGEDDLNTSGMVVKNDGTLTFKLIGDIQVAGKTIPEATAIVNDRFRKYIYYPEVSLIPYEMRNASITIIGKVATPGVFYFDGQLKAASAIAKAGGLSVGIFDNNTIEMADLEHSYLKRGNNILPVNFAKLIQQGDMRHNIPLLDGDYIYIASAMNQEVFILGDVPHPGYFGYSDRMTLARLVSKAEGLLSSANDHAIVLRGNIKNPRVYKVNVRKILRGETRDFVIEPNDLVYIPKSGVGKWNEFIEQLMPTLEMTVSSLMIERSVYDIQQR
jgi:polysaccharide export outer membrane protein